MLNTHNLVGALFSIMALSAQAYEYTPEELSQYSFTLKYGSEHDVCRAYLKELNASPVKVVPYCQRFIDFKNKDFTQLKWISMNTEFFYAMHEKVDNFIAYKDQNIKRETNKHAKRAVRRPSADAKKDESKPKEGGTETPPRPILGTMSAWRSEPLIDINNDGEADNVVIWQSGHCNSTSRPAVSGIFFLDKSYENIDSQLMFSIIEHPDKGWKNAPNIRRFRFLSNKMGSFIFKGKAYIDGFPGKNENSFTKSNGADLEVFLHEKGETKLMCGYEWHKGENND